jgi:aminotransferase EvaB
MMARNIIPVNDLKRNYQAYQGELESATLEAMRSGWWLNGQLNHRFCTNFATYLGVKHFIGVANGTDALELSIRALALQRASNSFEVVTVANAGGYATAAIFSAGLRPVWCDIEADTQLISIQSAVSCLNERSLAVVVTHLYGGLVDVLALRLRMDAAGYSNVAIIEDCAQAHGLRGNSGTAGAMGDIAAFSFYPTKNLGALGDGGGIATNYPDLNNLVRHLQQYGWDKKYEITVPGGRNSRLDEIQAAILGVLLANLDAANAKRQKILEAYRSVLKPCAQIVKSPLGTVAHLAVLIVPNRDVVRSHFQERCISTEIHYPILDHQQPGWQRLGGLIAPGGLPVSDRFKEKILTIPCFPTMTDLEVETVVDALQKIPEVGVK